MLPGRLGGDVVGERDVEVIFTTFILYGGQRVEIQTYLRPRRRLRIYQTIKIAENNWQNAHFLCVHVYFER